MVEGIAGVIVGLLIGGVVVWLWMDRRASNPNTVQALKRENECFREEVNEHFIQTAALINQLTDSYKAVFDHLSEGAEKLVDEKAVRERMPQVGTEEIRLKRLGAPREDGGEPIQDHVPEPVEEPKPAEELAEQTAKEPREEPAEELVQDSEQPKQQTQDHERIPESEQGQIEADDPGQDADQLREQRQTSTEKA